MFFGRRVGAGWVAGGLVARLPVAGFLEAGFLMTGSSYQLLARIRRRLPATSYQRFWWPATWLLNLLVAGGWPLVATLRPPSHRYLLVFKPPATSHHGFFFPEGGGGVGED